MRIMKDIQSERLEDSLSIDKVGIKNLRYPVIVKDKHYKSQATVASINMYVQLPKQFRGTHMSRFMEIISDLSRKRLNPDRIRQVLVQIKKSLDARAAHIEFFFPYFIDKAAPVSRSIGLVEHQCGLFGEHDESDRFRLVLEVNTYVLNLCPCSRELSAGKSAHNQRGKVTVKIQSGPLIWIEDIVKIIEESASSPVYPILKRSDEKAVMDHAHDKPRFVEDIVREIARKLESLHGVNWYSVEAENYESIHHHNVYAYIEKQMNPAELR